MYSIIFSYFTIFIRKHYNERDKNIKITTKPIYLKIKIRKWVKDVFICWKLINDKCLPKKVYMMKTNYDLKKV
jgi:hypothetical protein